MDTISLRQVFSDYPEKYVIAAIVGRDKRNFASKFYVLHSTVNKIEAKVILNKVLAEGVNSVLIPTFKEKQVLMIRLPDSEEVKFEPMQTHKEAAQFFRHYYNLTNVTQI